MTMKSNIKLINNSDVVGIRMMAAKQVTLRMPKHKIMSASEKKPKYIVNHKVNEVNIIHRNRRKQYNEDFQQFVSLIH